MGDHTVPMRGGWIMVKEPVTLAARGGVQIRLTPLAILYATPVRVHVAGYFMRTHAFSDEQRFFKDQPIDLLYKERRGAKLDEFEEEKLRIARIHWQAWNMEEPELEMQVRVQTENGDAVLNPHEFTIIDTIDPYIECIGNEYTLVELGGFTAKGKMAEQMHYLRARGIPRVEAFKMIAGTINKPGVFKLEPHPGLLDYFGYAA